MAQRGLGGPRWGRRLTLRRSRGDADSGADADADDADERADERRVASRLHNRQRLRAVGGSPRFAAGAGAGAAAAAEARLDLDVAGMDGNDGDEPLQAQILSQKRLATYYGEVHIGGQPFKGARQPARALQLRSSSRQPTPHCRPLPPPSPRPNAPRRSAF